MIRTLLLSASLLASTAAAAQAPETPAVAAQAKPDADTLAAAHEFLRVADVKGQMHALMPRIAQAAGSQLQALFRDHQVPEGLQNQFVAAIQAHMASLDTMLTPKVLDSFALAYAHHFTAAELHHLTALLGDPAMIRYRTVMPEVAAEMIPIVMTAMRPQEDAFQAKMKQIVADWIRTHPEDKAKLAKPIAS